MAIITSKVKRLIKKIALYKVSDFSGKHLLIKTLGTAKASSSNENNGERSAHVLPETGEHHLSVMLYQFELERAKALAGA